MVHFITGNHRLKFRNWSGMQYSNHEGLKFPNGNSHGCEKAGDACSCCLEVYITDFGRSLSDKPSRCLLGMNSEVEWKKTLSCFLVALQGRKESYFTWIVNIILVHTCLCFIVISFKDEVKLIHTQNDLPESLNLNLSWIFMTFSPFRLDGIGTNNLSRL